MNFVLVECQNMMLESVSIILAIRQPCVLNTLK